VRAMGGVMRSRATPALRDGGRGDHEFKCGDGDAPACGIG
jgi:hypothetical protein